MSKRFDDTLSKLKNLGVHPTEVYVEAELDDYALELKMERLPGETDGEFRTRIRKQIGLSETFADERFSNEHDPEFLTALKDL